MKDEPGRMGDVKPVIKKKKFPCPKSKCKGTLDMENIKIISGLKSVAKCKICGAEQKLVRTKLAESLKDGPRAKRATKKQFRSKKERRKARAEAKANANRIAATGVKYVP